MVASPHPQKMTVQEYLEWEPYQELCYEYCNGEVFAMSGGTKNHDELAFNLRRSLINRVEEQGCNMSGSDVKVADQLSTDAGRVLSLGRRADVAILSL